MVTSPKRDVKMATIAIEGKIERTESEPGTLTACEECWKKVAVVTPCTFQCLPQMLEENALLCAACKEFLRAVCLRFAEDGE